MRRPREGKQKNSLENAEQLEEPMIPLNKVSSQLANRLRLQKLPQLVLPEFLPMDDKVNRYFQEYRRFFEQNNNLNNKLAEVIEERNRLADQFNAIKRTRSTQEAVKRKRRYARDIERLFYCPIDKCNRGYGSQGSLSHHVRLKHIDFYQNGQYQIFIQKYIDKMVQNKKRGEEQSNNEMQAASKLIKHEQRAKKSVKQEIEQWDVMIKQEQK